MIRLCLMGCGVLVQTPESSLVAGMKWLQGTYTQRYNSLHELFGHLFQGRYKAVIVDGRERRTIFRSSAGRRRESHSGPARVAHGEAAAGRLLAEGLAVLGLSGATLGGVAAERAGKAGAGVVAAGAEHPKD